MSKLNIPTYKDLNINIKQILWSQMPKNFKEFQKLCERDFIIKLNLFLKKTNQLSSSLFKEIYQVIFFHGFVNYRKELMLKRLLEANGYHVSISDLKLDGIFKVDLIATRNSKIFFIQLKSNWNHQFDLSKLKQLSKIHNDIPILAIKTTKSFLFYDLVKNIQTNLF